MFALLRNTIVCQERENIFIHQCLKVIFFHMMVCNGDLFRFFLMILMYIIKYLKFSCHFHHHRLGIKMKNCRKIESLLNTILYTLSCVHLFFSCKYTKVPVPVA